MYTPGSYTGSIPETYDRLLGPLLFEPYARDLAARLRPRAGERILELACGTGILTRAIVQGLPPDAQLIATDLNEAMLAVARRHVPATPRITFRQADACNLPFNDGEFDALAAQFGVMFFPDKPRAMQEARRVLRRGGRYLFSVWDSLDHNPIPRAVHEAAAAHFPSNPSDFLQAGPYGFFNGGVIERVLRNAGFTNIACEHVDFPSIAPTAADAAQAFIGGTPLLLQLQERGMQDTTPIRNAAARMLAKHCGDRPCRSTMRALVFTAHQAEKRVAWL